MAKCSKCGSPLCKCGSPNHYSNSPAKFIGPNLNMSLVNAAKQAEQASQQATQPMTNVPPAPSSVVNPFPPQTQAAANSVFGDQQTRQNACSAPLMYKDGSPLEGNAFIAAKIAAEKAGKSSFKVGGKTFPVK